MVWPTLGSRTAKEQNRTEQFDDEEAQRYGVQIKLINIACVLRATVDDISCSTAGGEGEVPLVLLLYEFPCNTGWVEGSTHMHAIYMGHVVSMLQTAVTHRSV